MKPTRTDAGNRARITVVALVAIAAGIAGLLVVSGVFGEDRRQSPVLDRPTLDLLGQWWAPWAGLAVCALLLVVAGRWLLVQLRTGTIHGLLIEQRREGRVDMPARAVTDALAADIMDTPGVAGAKASLRGRETAPRVDLRVDLDETADLRAVRTAVESEATGRLAQAFGRPLPVEVEYRLPKQTGRALH